MSPLIQAGELHARLGEAKLAVVDGSWAMPGSDGGDTCSAFRAGHIKEAVFLDLEDCSDYRSPLPHMLPTPEAFAAYVGERGIGNDHEVVVYDRAGCFSSARWWWMFRAFGHEKVRVLDGGLPAWLHAGHLLESGDHETTPVPFKAVLQPKLLATREQVEQQLAKGGTVLDARSPGRFLGREREPRPGMRCGHMKGASNLYYPEVLNTDQTFRTLPELAAMMPPLAKDACIVTTCGSGITACILALALKLIGHDDVAVYDGSWAEWGVSGLPVEAA